MTNQHTRGVNCKKEAWQCCPIAISSLDQGSLHMWRRAVKHCFQSLSVSICSKNNVNSLIGTQAKNNGREVQPFEKTFSTFGETFVCAAFWQRSARTSFSPCPTESSNLAWVTWINDGFNRIKLGIEQWWIWSHFPASLADSCCSSCTSFCRCDM